MKEKTADEMFEELGFKNCNISLNCQGKRKTAYGFKWRYLDE